jgi:hypothetical protein
VLNPNSLICLGSNQLEAKNTIDECLLLPGYRRKYKFQLRILKKEVEPFLQQEIKPFISEIEEREFSYQLRSIAQPFVQVVDEYLQWSLTGRGFSYEE